MARQSEAPRQKDIDSLRSFVAVDLDPNVVRAICALQRQLSVTTADVRWVRPEGMHVTLKFLGSVKTALLPRLQSALAATLADQSTFQLQVHGLGAFPTLRRPRVLWVGLVGEDLGALARRIDAAVEPLGFDVERRTFSGHVTLGRVNTLRGWGSLEELFKTHLDDDFGSNEVRSVVLYHSKLQPGGSVYTALWTIPLQQNKGGHYDD